MVADSLQALAILSLSSALIGAVLEYLWHALNNKDGE